MTKKELIKELATKMEQSQKASEEVINAMLEIMAEKLEAGEEVNIHAFGKFYVKERGARVCRNPKTGEEVNVPAKKVVAFKPAKALADTINQ